MPDISEYSMIGNCRSAALISRHGSIDWCCLPDFDSPAIFSALLDEDNGGHFSISPIKEYKSGQAYINDTNVVSTVFNTSDGNVEVMDAFVATTDLVKKLSLFPDHEILRIVTCSEGRVQLKMEFAPTIFYGKRKADIQNNKKLGFKFCFKENSYILQSNIDLEEANISENKLVAFFEINKGETIIFSLSSSSQSPAILPEITKSGYDRMMLTIEYWKSWIGQCSYSGVYKEEVKRSILSLKLLAHAPSGAIIAAPTTSLPEEIGGERNWDYRFCWLRDASFTVRVLIKLGFEQEVHAYMNWMTHATQLTRPKLQVVYSVFGNATLREFSLQWLSGFKNSKPVRIGNGAYNQHQLDVYGEVLDAFFSYSQIVNEFDKVNRKFILGLGNMICKLWDQPDNGIWEARSAPAHYTHSRVMAWIGLDRLIKLSAKYKWKDVDIDKYQRVKTALARDIEKLGFNKDVNSYVSFFKGSNLDASALVFSLVGYCDASSPRMISTVKAISKNLSGNKLIYRYRNLNDGLKGTEGSFGICNFWLVENFAKSGKIDKAVEMFDILLDHAGSNGLMSEQIDPETHELLGNYPQGFSHIGLINAALSINDAYQKGGLVACR
jgi:GH15 family glucan-1,4-alpha-glucosidase